ncbi:MAG: hypothetical protein PHQ23_14780, partial [Candidatus Wallbacteria bacterium]|nr:hypothetical protein [Candidatus Wallbacteria bacterium]
IILRNPRGDIVDAVCWSNHDGVYSRGEDKDMDSIVRNGQWVGMEEQGCIDSNPVSEKWVVTRDADYVDTNSAADWIITKTATPGAVFSDSVSQSGETLRKLTGGN